MYFKALKTSRWCKNWKDGFSTYTLRLGSRGRNGCVVPDLGKLEEATIRDWFLSFGVEQNATEKELWWKHERFGFHHPIEGSTDTFYEGGYKFEMSHEAHKKVFEVPSDSK